MIQCKVPGGRQDRGNKGRSMGGLDTLARWRERARMVRPEARPADWTERQAEPLYHREDTVPMESEADLDATSVTPACSRVPGRYDYW